MKRKQPLIEQISALILKKLNERFDTENEMYIFPFEVVYAPERPEGQILGQVKYSTEGMEPGTLESDRSYIDLPNIGTEEMDFEDFEDLAELSLELEADATLTNDLVNDFIQDAKKNRDRLQFYFSLTGGNAVYLLSEDNPVTLCYGVVVGVARLKAAQTCIDNLIDEVLSPTPYERSKRVKTIPVKDPSLN